MIKRCARKPCNLALDRGGGLSGSGPETPTLPLTPPSPSPPRLPSYASSGMLALRRLAPLQLAERGRSAAASYLPRASKARPRPRLAKAARARANEGEGEASDAGAAKLHACKNCQRSKTACNDERPCARACASACDGEARAVKRACAACKRSKVNQASMSARRTRALNLPPSARALNLPPSACSPSPAPLALNLSRPASQVKCDLDDHYPAPCSRCARLGVTCTPHVPHKKSKRSSSLDDSSDAFGAHLIPPSPSPPPQPTSPLPSPSPSPSPSLRRGARLRPRSLHRRLAHLRRLVARAALPLVAHRLVTPRHLPATPPRARIASHRRQLGIGAQPVPTACPRSWHRTWTSPRRHPPASASPHTAFPMRSTAPPAAWPAAWPAAYQRGSRTRSQRWTAC